jgi:phosphoenolpyruvate carboxylase
MQHIGLFGYSRGVGSVKLPRAISFTAALYSLGIPPELISTGRGLKQAKEEGTLELIEKQYPALREDLLAAGHFFSRENLSELAKHHTTFADVITDVTLIEEILGITLGPAEAEHREHETLVRKLTKDILSNTATADLKDTVRDMGVLRRSLG